MSRIKRWHLVAGHYAVELFRERLSPELWAEVHRFVVDEEYTTLRIDFESSGYSNPGYVGTPDNCQAPEGEDERTLVRAWIDADLHIVKELPAALQERLFDHFIEQVNEVELPTED